MEKSSRSEKLYVRIADKTRLVQDPSDVQAWARTRLAYQQHGAVDMPAVHLPHPRSVTVPVSFPRQLSAIPGMRLRSTPQLSFQPVKSQTKGSLLESPVVSGT